MFLSLVVPVRSIAQGTVSGELRVYHDVTITFNGPSSSESASPNPFLDYRLNVTFSKGSRSVVVPGYFAADGNAAHSGATGGNKWRVHFAPDEVGTWTYSASFRQGTNIAASTASGAGSAVSFDGASGSFTVGATNKTAPDFRAKGWLRYVGKPYPQFDDGDYFIRNGVGGPENFLGYDGFDNTPDGGYRHHFTPHLSDHDSSDDGLLWNGLGKSILGMMNYISELGMNSMYFITHTTGGDTNDTFPWTGPTAYSRYDVSKLAQWEILFSHMTRKGIELHFFFNEEENDLLINGGNLGNERKVYYREMIARFGHHLAVTWNIGEEINTTGGGRPTTAQIASYCAYIRSIDPYVHPIAGHNADDLDALFDPLLGNTNFEAATLQTTQNHYDDLGPEILREQLLYWADEAATAGRVWIMSNDEQGGWHTGLPTDASDPWHPEYRHRVLWGSLTAGAGVAYYWNPDVSTEDLRPREQMWKLSTRAVDFFQAYLPFEDMSPADHLTSESDDYVFMKSGEVYVIYLPDGGSTNLNLSGVSGTFDVRWFNPRDVNDSSLSLLTGSVSSVSGGGNVSIGNPPSSPSDDWVVLVESGSGGGGGPQLQSLELIDASNSQVISALTNGMTINLAVTGSQLSVNAVPASGVASVRFNLDSGVINRVENSAPYALNGDSGGTFTPWTPSLGGHILVVTPYSASGGSGTAGNPITVNFTVTQQTGNPPSAPSSLSATSVSSSQIELSWNDNAGDESGFRIERRAGSGSYAEIAQVAANVEFYADSVLNSGTTYTYRVRAYNASGNSGYSNEDSATTSSGGSGGSVSLQILPSSGTDAASGISTLNTYTHAFNFAEGSNTSINGVTFTPGFPNGSGGISAKNSTTSLSLTDSVTSKPLTITRGTGNGDSFQGVHSDVLVSLSPLADGDSYDLFNSFGIIGGSSGSLQAGSETTYTIGGLSSGTDYIARLYGEAWLDNPGQREVTVTINNDDYLIDWSDPAESGSNDQGRAFYLEFAYTATGSTQVINLTIEDAGSGPHMCGFTNQAVSSTLNAPSALSATAVSSSQINLSWNDNSGNESGFRIERSTGGGFSTIATVAANTTSYQNSGLTASTTYAYRIIAYNGSGDSSPSNQNSATTQSGGGTPGLLNQSQFSIHWVDSEETVSEDGAADNTIDGNSGTIWHTQYTGSPDDPKPHRLEIDLGGTFTVNELRYLPRQDAYLNGTILDYEIYVSTDGSNWTQVASGTWANNHSEKTAGFSAVSGVTHIALRDVGTGSAWTSAAEINVVGF